MQSSCVILLAGNGSNSVHRIVGGTVFLFIGCQEPLITRCAENLLADNGEMCGRIKFNAVVAFFNNTHIVQNSLNVVSDFRVLGKYLLQSCFVITPYERNITDIFMMQRTNGFSILFLGQKCYGFLCFALELVINISECAMSYWLNVTLGFGGCNLSQIRNGDRCGIVKLLSGRVKYSLGEFIGIRLIVENEAAFPKRGIISAEILYSFLQFQKTLSGHLFRELDGMDVCAVLLMETPFNRISVRFAFIAGRCGGFLHCLILGKRLCFAVAAVNPFLEFFNGDGCADKFALFCPFFVVVACKGRLRLVSFIEAEHDLMLVKCAVLIVLVNNKRMTAVPSVNVVRKEHIYMVSVHTLRATNVAV